MNLYHELPTSPEGKEDEFHVVVDIPKGSANKYEYDEEGGFFSLDRTLHHSMFYPFEYGFIPQTKSLDGDAVDVSVLVTHPTFAGCVHTVKVIGILHTQDEDGDDPKIITVPTHKKDPRFDEINDIDDLPAHVKEEIRVFYKEYKHLEVKKYPHIKIGDWGNAQEAVQVIRDSQERYNAEHAS